MLKKHKHGGVSKKRFIRGSMYLARNTNLERYHHVSNGRRDSHSTWSSEPREGLAVGRVQLVPSFLSCFKTVNYGLSHDVTKIQTNKLSIILSFYFHEVLQHLKTFNYTNFRFQRGLLFAIEDSWIFRLLSDAAFSWRPRKLLCGLKTLLIFWDFVI